jgi:hypothetical protein
LRLGGLLLGLTQERSLTVERGGDATRQQQALHRLVRWGRNGEHGFRRVARHAQHQGHEGGERGSTLPEGRFSLGLGGLCAM